MKATLEAECHLHNTRLARAADPFSELQCESLQEMLDALMDAVHQGIYARYGLGPRPACSWALRSPLVRHFLLLWSQMFGCQ